MAGIEPASPGLQPGATTISATFPQAEGRGIEPLAQRLPWCSRPVADHSAVPSTIGEDGGT